ncbi:MAG: phage integrase SAM-like domain-containing protein, partial [Alistipes sp.]|nr:phage integrase SAM-like domain-containing protein [Alistipes sp.]
MASLMYIVRTTKTDADASIKVKMRLNAYIGKDEKGKPKKVSAYALSGVVIPKKIWDMEKNAIRKMYLKDDVEGGLYKSYNTTLGEIEAWVNARYNALGSDVVFTSDWLQGVVDDYWADIKRKEDTEREKQEAEAKKESLNAYIARYIEEISNGTRLTNKGTIYKHGTVKAIKASMTQFAEFQQANGISLNFDDIDLEFYRQYTAWLTRKGYTLNSLGKCIKDIKVIMTAAKDDELTTNEAYKAKKFRVTAEEADNIYLTKEELEAIAEVDLSKMAKGYEIARDV